MYILNLEDENQDEDASLARTPAARELT